jgi:large subunit ribosomal protein L35e
VVAQLRIKQVASGTASKLAQIKVARKNIARCLTAYNAKRRSEERAKITPGSLLPKPLRAKQTRAKRRELTAAQASKTVRRIAHRAANFPVRNYAVLA